MVVLPRLPSLVYSSAARILSPYEYMNYILVVEVLVRTPSGSVLGDRQHYNRELDIAGRL